MIGDDEGGNGIDPADIDESFIDAHLYDEDSEHDPGCTTAQVLSRVEDVVRHLNGDDVDDPFGEDEHQAPAPDLAPDAARSHNIGTCHNN